jgi:hypothetical protein
MSLASGCSSPSLLRLLTVNRSPSQCTECLRLKLFDMPPPHLSYDPVGKLMYRCSSSVAQLVSGLRLSCSHHKSPLLSPCPSNSILFLFGNVSLLHTAVPTAAVTLFFKAPLPFKWVPLYASSVMWPETYLGPVDLSFQTLHPSTKQLSRSPQLVNLPCFRLNKVGLFNSTYSMI